MPFIEQLGMQAAQGTLGAGMGLILGGIERKKQLEQQQKLQNMQIAGQMEMGRFNQQQALEMWEKTNFAAQKEQMKKAGLSPGLLYGMSGAGGAIANPTSGNVSGGQAAPMGPAAGMGIAMGNMQLALLDAQKKNIEADTKNKEVTTPKIETETKALLQGINNQIAQEALTKMETALKDLEKQFQSSTMKNRESLINMTLSKLIEETRIMENEREISDETKLDKIKMITAQLKDIISAQLLKDQQTATTKEQQAHITKQIERLNQEIQIDKIEEQMAKDGWNPKNAINPLKWLWNAINKIF